MRSQGLRHLLILLLAFAASMSVQARQLALSFDDGLDPKRDPNAAAINAAILGSLAQHRLQAIIFPALNKIGNEGLSLVAEWGQQGHRIGNHSAEHVNLNQPQVSLAAYIQGMAEADRVFRGLKGFVPRYRFPYLKEGDTAAKRDAVRQWLHSHAYRSAAVSIDASDWYYNQLFLRYQAANDAEALHKLKSAYIAHLLDRANYYDGLAQQTLGRSPKHVLLLHLRAMNAAWLDDLMQAFAQAGWQFVDTETAYRDPLYQIQLNFLPAGESILWSIAKVYGIAGLRYPAEDAPYEQANLERHGLTLTPP